MIQKSRIAVIYQSRLIIEKTVVHHLKSLSMRRQLWWQKQFRLIPLTYYQQFLSFSSYLNNVEGECGWKHFIIRHENLVPPIIMWKLDENVLILRIASWRVAHWWTFSHYEGECRFNVIYLYGGPSYPLNNLRLERRVVGYTLFNAMKIWFLQ